MEGVFNTFRLGVAWKKRIGPGDTVFITCKSKSLVIGVAKVLFVEVGELSEMAGLHASLNHNHKGSSDPKATLVSGMIKRYGPHKCGENSKVAVIYLEIIETGLQQNFI